MADFYNYCNWYTVWDAKTGDLIASGTSAMVARRLGYNAYVVSGGVGRKDSDHAWVMICENGVPYIYDVELEWGYRAGRYGHAEYNMYKMPLNKTVFSYQFP